MKMKKFEIEIVKLDDHEISFDISDFSFAFANAMRRILLAEIPTMAIEKIHLYNNTSVMHDEFLGHRLGLIPIAADANQFEFIEDQTATNSGGDDDTVETEKNAIIFNLNIQNPPTNKENLNVFSGDLKWEPIGDQLTTFVDIPIRPVCDDILITKLAPSQQIDAKLFCRKGLGKDHAKYSPVAGCFYRYLTTFRFVDSFTKEEIEKLKICFPKGYIDFDGTDDDNDNNGYPSIVQPRLETSDTTFLSCPSLRNKIEITTDKQRLNFVVESIGTIAPVELITTSLDVLKSKCTTFYKIISKSKTS